MTTAIQAASYITKKMVYGEMQLQKLLYYSQAWSLAWTGKPLFTDEIEAWKEGPVVRSVWVARKYGSDAIGEEADLDDDQRAIIDAVYDFYGTNGGAVLSVMTHAEQPWVEARDGLAAHQRSTAPVSQATMRRFYTLCVVDGKSRTPKPPLKRSKASATEVQAVGRLQSVRWRGALDALATR
jgi:uncharacterized phage-associated protein